MELIDLDPVSQSRQLTIRQQQQQQQQPIAVQYVGRFAWWRKFSLLICFLETLVIALFLIYISFQKSPLQISSPPTYSLSISPISNTFETYSNGINSSKILVGLVNGCNQRLHDLNFSVKCESKNISACQTISPIPPSQVGQPQSGQQSGSVSLRMATLITTSKSGLRLDTKQMLMKQIRCPSSEPIDLSCRFKTQLSVNLSEPHQQEIIGWGGALTDSSINNILSLSTNGTKRLLDDYFGTDGLMFNMIRITIGGSDFSSRFYTNDDRESNGNNVSLLNNFRLKEEDVLYKIPMIKYIQDEYTISGGGLKTFASMWSPPTWMKTNEHFNKGFLKGSISGPDMKTDSPEAERYFRALAELKKNFILAYQNNSIQFWGLTVMNEPLFAIQPFLNFNTMIFPKDDYGNYVAKYLGPTIKEDDRLKHIKLLVHDDNRRYLINYTDPILSMNGVRRYIDGVSVHGYVDEQYHLMDEIYARHKLDDSDFFLLPTELCSGHLPFMEKALIGNWNRGVHYALDIIHSLQHLAAGWVDWNMALDITGGPGWLGGKLDSPIIVDKNEDAYHKSPMYYVLGQFSRYIPPNSLKVKTKIINDIYDYHFETVTFLLPGGKDLATVVLNNNPYDIELNIRLIDQQQQQRPGQLSNSDTLYQVICERESIVTIIYPKSLASY